MTDAEKRLSALIFRLETMTKPDRAIDQEIVDAIQQTEGDAPAWNLLDQPNREPLHFTSSIDAAMRLIPKGYDYGISCSQQHGLETWVQKPFKGGDCYQGYAPEGTDGDSTRAIALSIAALYARSINKPL